MNNARIDAWRYLHASCIWISNLQIYEYVRFYIYIYIYICILYIAYVIANVRCALTCRVLTKTYVECIFRAPKPRIIKSGANVRDRNKSTPRSALFHPTALKQQKPHGWKPRVIKRFLLKYIMVNAVTIPFLWSQDTTRFQWVETPMHSYVSV